MNRTQLSSCGRPATHRIAAVSPVEYVRVEAGDKRPTYCKRHAAVEARHLTAAIAKMINRHAAESGRGYVAERDDYIAEHTTKTLQQLHEEGAYERA